MTTRNRLMLWLLLLSVAFLSGFLPQYLKSRKIRNELQAAQTEIASYQFKGRLGQLRDLSSLIYFETTQKNYGIAGQYSTQFFGELRQVANETSDTTLKRLLEELSTSRDSITAGLAQGDPAVLASVQVLFTKIHESSKSYK